MRRRIPARWTWILILLLLLPGLGSARAQDGGTIGYGSSVFGSITADRPQVLYRFDGTAGDLASIDVIGLTGGLDPALIVNDPNGEPAAADSDRFATDSQDVRLAVFLALSGTYTLVVSGANGSTGDFMLRLRGRPAMPGVPLEPGVPVTVAVPPNAPPQYFTFEAGQCATELAVSAVADGWPAQVKVRSAEGREIALLRGAETRALRLVVAPLSGQYEVEVLAEDPTLTGGLVLRADCAGEALPESPTPAETGGQAAPPLIPAAPPHSAEEQPAPDCSAFRLAGSLDSMANGPQVFTWDPAPGATRYRLNLYGDGGALVRTQDVSASATTVTLDVSTEAIGGGFLFTVEVLALYGEVPGCVSQVQTLRQPPPR